MNAIDIYKQDQHRRISNESKIHSEYYNLYTGLAHRFNTFKQIFKYLDTISNPVIVETGISRSINNYTGDGHSTLLFDEYLHFFKMSGSLTTIDINPSTCEFTKQILSSKSTVICSDSINALNDLSNDPQFPLIDFLYMDSYDVDWNNPHPSAFHHVKELLAILPKLKRGTLIVVDDHDNGKGKGKYIAEYMSHINKVPYFNEYQIGWIW
jgi:hypothetical protein